MTSPMNSPTRKRGAEEGEEREAQSMSKFLITEEKLIPAINTKDVYSCKTCNKEFKSLQALGGHRASHNFKNPKSVTADTAPGPVTTKSHDCRICFEKFDSGQALGGYMRKHCSNAIEEKANLELFKDKTVSENSSTSKSDLTHERDESRCNRSTPVTRDFFPVEPIRARAFQMEMVPALERADSWLDLKLGL